uniref:Uncharacterized protein n=1 Tax=Ascaris lumbricoides TaxID=6252 RepID=A0A0M3HKL2_ASCLU
MALNATKIFGVLIATFTARYHFVLRLFLRVETFIVLSKIFFSFFLIIF